MHHNRNSNYSFRLELLLSKQNYHVNVEARNIRIFVKNISNIVGHVSNKIVVLILNYRSKRWSHHHVKSFFEILVIFFWWRYDKAEGEKFLQLIRCQNKCITQVKFCKHQNLHFLFIYDSHLSKNVCQLMEIIFRVAINWLSSSHQILTCETTNSLPIFSFYGLLDWSQISMSCHVA